MGAGMGDSVLLIILAGGDGFPGTGEGWGETTQLHSSCLCHGIRDVVKAPGITIFNHRRMLST